jgi:LSD1 subclass zinc finger protein
MPLTTQCPRCRTVLHLPDGAAHRRLKCPKCETKFFSGTEDSTPPKSAPAFDSAAPASASFPAPRGSEPDLPVVSGTLRDTFDLPLLDDPAVPAMKRKAVSEVASLFDDAPAPRKLTTAAARSKPRRCTSCGWVVPAGMSLCDRCGLDLDTGQRHLPEEEFADEELPLAEGPAGPPAGIILVGVVAMAASAILAIMSLIMVEQVVGKVSFGLVCAFGAYASYEFLVGKSYKLLLVALMLGATVDVVGLVVLPMLAANEGSVVVDQDSVPDLDPTEMPKIKNMTQDPELTHKIGWGIGILLVSAAAFVYLATASDVHRYFRRSSTSGPPFP